MLEKAIVRMKQCFSVLNLNLFNLFYWSSFKIELWIFITESFCLTTDRLKTVQWFIIAQCLKTDNRILSRSFLSRSFKNYILIADR